MTMHAYETTCDDNFLHEYLLAFVKIMHKINECYLPKIVYGVQTTRLK